MTRSFAVALVGLLMVIGCDTSAPRAATSTAEPAEAQAVRAARAEQNKAITEWDSATVAKYWTDDVEIRRGLGVLVVGKSEYIKLFVRDSAALANGTALVYQRTPVSVSVSSTWPLAYEEGTWEGHYGAADGPTRIGGRYSAQWVKRDGKWLIRGEVYVALTCKDAGCDSKAVP